MASTSNPNAITTGGPQGPRGKSSQNQSELLSEASRARIENWRSNVEGSTNDETVSDQARAKQTVRISQKPQEKTVRLDEGPPSGVTPLISKALLHAIAFIVENA
ncbi:hypothetical protein FA13DRAFT_1798516 [Coprinellus micaceus]|uniref:Uncharacterized protein n=1 Tax=Coprinellus micaceus TaxID=71717 RepID=A0A4Y7SLR6_COPMI|nr:hypothetical protein FA13DRAFT_1798516 [Coprinellus micaceus]